MDKNKIKLEELAKGNLPKHLLKSIGESKITIEELGAWNKSQPAFYIAFENGFLNLQLRIRWSMKKLITISGSIIGLIWAILKYAIDFLPSK